MLIAICGCGALGSHIALLLTRPGSEIELLLIDDDQVEEANIATSAFSLYHVGTRKAEALGELVYGKARVLSQIHARTLDERNRQLLNAADLIVDTFDNGRARTLTMGCLAPTVHVGVSEDRIGSVIWDDRYTPPQDAYERGENPICTHHLGTGVLSVTAALAAEAIRKFIASGERHNFLFSADRLEIWR